MIKTVCINDIEMDYAVFNFGKKPFVIIPGLSLGSVMKSADAVEERYGKSREDYTLYLIDRRKNPPENYNVEQMAEDTACVMEEIGIKNACVFGASQGGMIAQTIAENHTSLVSALVIGSSLAKTNPTVESVIGNWVSLAEDGNIKALASDILDKIYSRRTLEKYREILMSYYGDITKDDLKQFAVSAKAAAGFSSPEKLSEIKCPVFVIGSKGDKVTTAKGSEELAKELNCGLYLYDENYGHGVYDEAEDYPERIFDFFKQVSD